MARGPSQYARVRRSGWHPVDRAAVEALFQAGIELTAGRAPAQFRQHPAKRHIASLAHALTGLVLLLAPVRAERIARVIAPLIGRRRVIGAAAGGTAIGP